MAQFLTTTWEMIDLARLGESKATRAFVDRYRPPIVQYLTLQGLGNEAEDLAQEVFLRIFARELLEKADPDRGRFRSYLLAVTRNVVSEHRKRQAAQKRGGGHTRVELTDDAATTHDPSFDACWSRDLLERGIAQLRQENPRQHKVLKLRMLDELGYPEISERIGVPPEQVRPIVHRAKKRLFVLVRKEIAGYCSSEEELNEEIAALLGSFDAK